MSQKIFSKTGKKIIDLILYSKQRNQTMKATSGQLEYKKKNKKQKNLLNDFNFQNRMHLQGIFEGLEIKMPFHL